MNIFSFLIPDFKSSEKTEPIFFYNSLSQQKEEFVSSDKKHVTMYSCGPTVYDHVHIGNLRSFLMADLIKRVLLYNGFDVKHTINFTDFGHLTGDGDEGEDKMMKALKREGQPISLTAMNSLAQKYIQSFKEDTEALRALPPTTYTPASNYVQDQIRLVKTLFEKGYAYETSDGVYYDVKKFPTYGQLGNVDTTKQEDGARVEINKEKHNPADFALWKKGLLGWESPWGKGFPGWHIECTAMAFATLGKQIDIHTGGEDLKYTHHNGEIAQAEAATGKPYVSYWLHNAHVTVNDEKIAKSKGNGIRLSSLLDEGIPSVVYRYWLLTSHYRTTVNVTIETLKASRQALFRLKRFVFETGKNKSGNIHKKYESEFHKAINDDLDTPKAVALMWELVKDDAVSIEDKVATLKEMDTVLDIGLNDDKDDVVLELGVVSQNDIPEEIQNLLEKRELARTTQNWDEADRVREELNFKGYTVEDTPQGQKISKK